MIQEFKNVSQLRNERRRKYFFDEYFDIYVWFNSDNTLYGFQICYAVDINEHSITWKKDYEFTHDSVDDGSISGTNKKTPVLLSNGPFPYKSVIDELLNRIDPDDSNKEYLIFIYDKLIEYTNNGGKLI